MGTVASRLLLPPIEILLISLALACIIQNSSQGRVALVAYLALSQDCYSTPFVMLCFVLSSLLLLPNPSSYLTQPVLAASLSSLPPRASLNILSLPSLAALSSSLLATLSLPQKTVTTIAVTVSTFTTFTPTVVISYLGLIIYF